MDVFISNIPKDTNKVQLERFLRGILVKLSIKIFECRKDQKKTFAIVTFLHNTDGQLFLRKYGDEPQGDIQQTQRSSQEQPIQKVRLRYLSAYLQCKPGHKSPDTWALKSLEMLEKKNNQQAHGQQATQPQHKPQRRDLKGSSLLCGTWDYRDSSHVFTAHAEWENDWKARFGKRNLMIFVGIQEFCIRIAYASIYNITFEGDPQPSITFTLREAPYMSQGKSDLLLLFEKVSIDTRKRSADSKPMRVCFLGPGSEHEALVATCWVYRISLCHSISNAQMTEFLRNKDVYPASFQHTEVQSPKKSHAASFKLLMTLLVNFPYTLLPFGVKFQVQKLASNGFLQPALVRDLLPEIEQMVKRSGGEVTALAIRKLFIRDQIPFAGPGTDVSELSYSTIISLLRENEDLAVKEVSFEAMSKGSSDNVAIIYRVLVTPAGVYLAGPEPEANNRVLRKYVSHRDHFLRVTFCDEDGSQVRFNPKVLNDNVFCDRFGGILQQGIFIGGNRFSFLGFSHSSLRAQSCWFMSPFVENGTLMLPDMVIRKLGDFSGIRCPAKCAARIGQAFSDSREIVTLDPRIVKTTGDVKRNGRTFSDGVGSFSMDFLNHMWESLPFSYGSRPTCFQVRYKGAKGMLSLDSRLKGSVVLIRPSMVKFSGSDGTDNNIEICGSSSKPLRMYLNRQLIKIMEDCGVDAHWFMNLQRKAVQELRSITQSAQNAASFVETRHTGRSFYLSWFIRKLNALGMAFQEDDFLKNVIEMMVLVELRNLKHRSRIPVEKGHTLYGLMDETDTLREGEVFVITSKEPGESEKEVLVGKNIIVTRSPALAPGDVQLVEAVDVPPDHPLRKLSNCICFSQNGNRDLPSQLSGGDLDGDLYHIIYDPAAIVKYTFLPADYPRAEPDDIGRTVMPHDMIQFFVTFMATDQLGRIATLHQVLADKEDLGTLSPDCLKLADLHSTAVDYSKTGIPVDLTRLPNVGRYRPDFMATGPIALLGQKGDVTLTSQPDNEEEDENEEEDGFVEYKYYESKKILGHLYRDIDELAIFEDLQRKSGTRLHSKRDFIRELWQLIQGHCYLIEWTHHMELANEIRDSYEDTVLSIMTEYAPNYRHPLSELEVFIGQIVGKTTAQNKRHRDLSTSMKERFDDSVAGTVNHIIRDGPRIADDSLERSMACLAVALEPGKKTRKGSNLVSFKYIAAAVCLKEAERICGQLYNSNYQRK